MSITLSVGAATITLPPDLIWTDQHTWSPVSQAYAPAITGAAIIDVGVKTAGRPITLTGDVSHSWLRYDVVVQLKAWAALPECQMTLNINGTPFSVLFRHYEPPAVDLVPVVDYSIPDAADWFYGQLKFMEL